MLLLPSGEIKKSFFFFQAVVTEYLIRYCELIFSEKMPVYHNVSGSGNNHSNTSQSSTAAGNDSIASVAATVTPGAARATPNKQQLRPKSLAISTPTKLLSLEEAR